MSRSLSLRADSFRGPFSQVFLVSSFPEGPMDLGEFLFLEVLAFFHFFNDFQHFLVVLPAWADIYYGCEKSGVLLFKLHVSSRL